MKAQAYLQPDETAVVVFTKGRNLRLRDDGTGTTGDWVVRGDLNVDKVIVYHRKEEPDVN